MSIKSAAKAASVVVLTSLLYLGAGAGTASASIISFQGLGKSDFVAVKYGATEYDIYAGELNWGWVGTPPSGYSPTFYAYCVDLFDSVTSTQNVTVSSTNALVGTGVVTDGGAKAAWLFDNYAPTVHASGTTTDAAALQVAIWEALYDTSANLTGGAFQLLTTGAIATKATSYLSALYTGGAPGYHTAAGTWLDAPSGAGQDQVLQPVPEPASLVLLGAGLVGVARVVRRRRTRTKAAGQSQPAV